VDTLNNTRPGKIGNRFANFLAVGIGKNEFGFTRARYPYFGVLVYIAVSMATQHNLFFPATHRTVQILY
jgi:hypothetical protein